MKSKMMYFLSVMAVTTIAVISLSFSRTGSPATATEQQTVEPFKHLSVGGSFKVYVSQGASYTVKMEGDNEELAKIEVSVKEETLIIKPKKENTNIKGEIKIYITTSELGRIELAGSGIIKLESKFTNNNSMDVSIAGSGIIEGSVSSPDLDAEIAGSGNIELSGDTKDLDIDIAGSGSFKGKSLAAERVDVDIAGSGSAYVSASANLNVDIAGSGNVYYSGSPAITRDIAGSGDVIKN